MIAATGAEATLDGAGVENWLTGRGFAFSGPLSFEVLSAGRSNLTFVASDAAGESWILRRPPGGPAANGAHDVGREFRVLEALHRSAGPAVPEPLLLCEDPAVTGAPFYLMERLTGHILRTAGDSAGLPPAARRAAAFSLVDQMAALHRLDPAAVGLGDLGRPAGFVERQLARWLAHEPLLPDADRPTFRRAHGLLAAAVPATTRDGIVHGDLRLDNVVLDDSGAVIGVLDWELCTLGDVLTDLGWLLLYWIPRPLPWQRAFLPTASCADGFPEKGELAARYLGQVDLAEPDLRFYLGFAHWRLAAISAGVRARYAGGQAAGEEVDSGDLGRLSTILVATALEILEGEGLP